MYTIGYDLGSSSVKCVILDVEQGIPVASGSYPRRQTVLQFRILHLNKKLFNINIA